MNGNSADAGYVSGLYEKFAELVSIDSVSFSERKMADRLIGELENLGFEVTEDDAGKVYGSDTGNIYGFLQGTDRSRPPVLLSAHMDTVVPGLGKRAVLDPGTGIVTSEGDTVLGSDDVSGIVEILEGIRLAKADPAGHGDIEVLFTIAEEVYGKGSRAFDFSRVRSKKAFVIDMSGRPGNAAVAAPSIILFDFTITGRSAHAGYDPEAGINSIAIAADIILGTRQGRLSETMTFNIGTISGGTIPNAVSGSCECRGEARSLDHDEAAAEVAALERKVKEACEARGASYTFSSEVMIRAYETGNDSGVCKDFTAACSKLGLEGRFVTTRGGSDNNVFAQHGIEGIVVSSGMQNTHTTSEYMYAEDLAVGAELVVELLRLQQA